MADAVSRVTSGQKIGVFAMQHGPGSENAFGGVAQAYGESVPIVVLPGGYPRASPTSRRTSTPSLNYRHVTKWCEQVTLPAADARTRCAAPSPRSRTAGRAPSSSRFPSTSSRRTCAEPIDYTPALRTRFGPDPQAVAEVARVLLDAERPVIYAGQGVHYAAGVAAAARAGGAARGAGDDEPAGQERVPGEPPALARLRRSRRFPSGCHHFLTELRRRSSASAAASPRTNFGVAHAARARPSSTPRWTRPTSTRTSPAEHALIGDAELTLEALIAEVQAIGSKASRAAGKAAVTAADHDASRREWLASSGCRKLTVERRRRSRPTA